MDNTQGNRLLRLPEVAMLTSLGKSTINLWVAQGRFPAPTALSATIKVWRLREVEEWIENVFCKVSVQREANETETSNVIDFPPSGHGRDSETPPLPKEQQAERL